MNTGVSAASNQHPRGNRNDKPHFLKMSGYRCHEEPASLNDPPRTGNALGLVTSVGTGLVVVWDSQGRKVSSTIEGVTTNWKYGGEVREDSLGGNQRIDLGWAVSHLDTSSHEYRVFDFRGNAKLVLDDQGEVTTHRHYSGYGQVYPVITYRDTCIRIISVRRSRKEEVEICEG
jgi:hypothetical protein